MIHVWNWKKSIHLIHLIHLISRTIKFATQVMSSNIEIKYVSDGLLLPRTWSYPGKSTVMTAKLNVSNHSSWIKYCNFHGCEKNILWYLLQLCDVLDFLPNVFGVRILSQIYHIKLFPSLHMHGRLVTILGNNFENQVNRIFTSSWYWLFTLRYICRLQQYFVQSHNANQDDWRKAHIIFCHFHVKICLQK